MTVQNIKYNRWFVLCFIFFCISVLLSLFHGQLINVGKRFDEGLRTALHYEIITQDEALPWTYRILVPYTAQGLNELLTQLFGGHVPISQERLTIENCYLVIRAATLFATFIGFQKLLEHWLDPAWAFCGVMFFAFLHGPTFIFYWFQPSSPLDLCLWIWAAHLTLSKKHYWLFPMVFIGSLNRETAVFMILIHFALQVDKAQFLPTTIRCIALTMVWATVFLGIRWLIPADNAEHAGRWSAYLQDNISNYHWLQYTFVFLSSWAILPILSWHKVPKKLKRLFFAMIPYIILIFLFGRIREVRLFLPLCIPLIPATIIHLKDSFEKTS